MYPVAYYTHLGGYLTNTLNKTCLKLISLPSMLNFALWWFPSQQMMLSSTQLIKLETWWSYTISPFCLLTHQVSIHALLDLSVEFPINLINFSPSPLSLPLFRPPIFLARLLNNHFTVLPDLFYTL